MADENLSTDGKGRPEEARARAASGPRAALHGSAGPLDARLRDASWRVVGGWLGILVLLIFVVGAFGGG